MIASRRHMVAATVVYGNAVDSICVYDHEIDMASLGIGASSSRTMAELNSQAQIF